MAKWPKFAHLEGNRGRGTRWWRQILDRKWKCGRFAHAQWKIRNINAHLRPNRRNSRVLKEIGVEDHDGDSQILDWKWKYLVHAMKNMDHNTYLWPNWRNFGILKEIGVDEHNSDIRFKSKSGNMAVSCMRNASGHNYRNSSSLWSCLWGRYHVPQNVFLLTSYLTFASNWYFQQ